MSARDKLHASWHKQPNFYASIASLQFMMKILFITCFVLVCLTSVQAYTDDDLLRQAEEVKAVLSIFYPDPWADDFVTLIKNAVVELKLIKSLEESELYQIVLDSVFQMYDHILFKGKNLANDISVALSTYESDFYFRESLYGRVKRYYGDFLEEIYCFVLFAKDYLKVLASEKEFFDAPENAPYKRLLITMFKSIFYTTEISIHEFFKKTPKNYMVYQLFLLQKNSKLNSGARNLLPIISRMKVNKCDEYLEIAADFIKRYLKKFYTYKAREIFLQLYTSEVPTIAAAART